MNPLTKGDNPGTVRNRSRTATGEAITNLGPNTSPLESDRADRTKPFDLEEHGPWPEGFTRERFSPTSRVRKFGRLELEVLCPRDLPGPVAELVYSELLRLMAEHSPYMPGRFLHRWFAKADSLIVARRHGVPIGYLTAGDQKLDGLDLCWFGQTVIHPRERGAYLTLILTLEHLWQAAWRRFPRGFYLAVRTPNPRVVGLLWASAPFYPRADRPTPPRVQEAARRYAAHVNPQAEFDPATSVMKRLVDVESVHSELQRHWNPTVNAFCDQRLDYEAGDMLLMISPYSWCHVLWLAARLVAMRLLAPWRSKGRTRA